MSITFSIHKPLENWLVDNWQEVKHRNPLTFLLHHVHNTDSSQNSLTSDTLVKVYNISLKPTRHSKYHIKFRMGAKVDHSYVITIGSHLLTLETIMWESEQANNIPTTCSMQQAISRINHLGSISRMASWKVRWPIPRPFLVDKSQQW
jgi:hypothetical protein